MPRSLETHLLRTAGGVLAATPILALTLAAVAFSMLVAVVLLLTNPSYTGPSTTSPAPTSTTRNCAPFTCTVGQ
ncbi:hypothetical protein AB0H76_39010 [Nocardia sp. NPDC050712]|uniref:hypothetical protein n=1 Tax=Nocardia sp. NPDC050712 TaxID=3155518 RepID=UPI0033FBCA28